MESTINNNNIVIESLRKNFREETSDDEKKTVLLDTIEDLEYQNETNEENNETFKIVLQ